MTSPGWTLQSVHMKQWQPSFRRLTSPSSQVLHDDSLITSSSSLSTGLCSTGSWPSATSLVQRRMLFFQIFIKNTSSNLKSQLVLSPLVICYCVFSPLRSKCSYPYSHPQPIFPFHRRVPVSTGPGWAPAPLPLSNPSKSSSSIQILFTKVLHHWPHYLPESSSILSNPLKRFSKPQKVLSWGWFWPQGTFVYIWKHFWLSQLRGVGC